MSKGLDAILQLLQAAGKRPAVSFGPEEDYQAYIERTSPSPGELEAQRNNPPAYSPRFAISLFGQHNAATLESLKKQSYDNWFVFDGSGFDYIIYLFPGDVLAPDALFCLASAAAGKPPALFADQDELEGGRRVRPLFKPEASEFTLLSYDCVGRPLAVCSGLHGRVPGPGGPSAAEHYGYALRVLAEAGHMQHVPRVLCSCPPAQVQDAREHVRRYLEQRGLPGCVLGGIWRGSYRVFLNQHKKANIVVPNRDNPGLRRLLESVEHCTAQASYGLTIADMGSQQARTLKYYEILERNRAAKVMRLAGMSLGAALNRGAQEAAADITVFLDPCCEMVSPSWLSALIEAIERGAAAAGPKLTDANGRITHAGGAVGIRGWAMSPYAYAADDTLEQRKNLFINTLRRVSVLSRLCLAVNTRRFFETGCFDETMPPCCIAAELCIRLNRMDDAVVYTPFSHARCHGEVFDFKSASGEELARCYDALRTMLKLGDPYYSPNFGLTSPIPRATPPVPAILLNPLYADA